MPVLLPPAALPDGYEVHQGRSVVRVPLHARAFEAEGEVLAHGLRRSGVPASGESLSHKTNAFFNGRLVFPADEFPGVAFELLHVAGTQSDVHDDACAIDPQDRGNDLVRDAVLLDGFPAVEEYPLVELVLLDVLLEDFLVLVPGVDGQDDQSVLLVLLGDATDVRSLRTAGRSPVGEEGDEDRLAALIAQANLGPVQSGQFKIRGRLVLHLGDEPTFGRPRAPGQTQDDQNRRRVPDSSHSNLSFGHPPTANGGTTRPQKRLRGMLFGRIPRCNTEVAALVLRDEVRAAIDSWRDCTFGDNHDVDLLDWSATLTRRRRWDRSTRLPMLVCGGERVEHLRGDERMEFCVRRRRT